MQNTRVKSAALAFIVIAALAVIWARAQGPLRDPHEALNDFYDAEFVAEGQVADPLIRTQCNAAPLVTQEIRDRNMKLRRYAIGYLGNRRCAVALPALRAIVQASDERSYFRGDALEAIWQIDRTAGMSLAQSHRTRSDYLGQRARVIVSGNKVGLSRS